MPQYGLGPREGGNASYLHITAPTVVKTSPGTVWRVNVNTFSSVSVSACYDAITVANTTLGVTAANLIGSIPASTTGVFELEWPCKNGIVVVPGTSAVLSVSYS